MQAYGQLLRSQQEKRNQLNDDLDEREIKQFADIAAVRMRFRGRAGSMVDDRVGVELGQEQQSVMDSEVGKREEGRVPLPLPVCCQE